jgi:hypothetical protein
VHETSLFVYDMPPEPFILSDANAGYWTSPTAATPLSRRAFTDLPERIAEHGATLIVPHRFAGFPTAASTLELLSISR